MTTNLVFSFIHATILAAEAVYPWIGSGDKKTIDRVAVDSMRKELNNIDMSGRIVIGEGEIDKAPMLFVGESVGTGHGNAIDIAIDPVEGTRMASMGQGNAISVLAFGEESSLLEAPDMYMEKLVVCPAAKGAINPDACLQTNLHNIAKKLNKSISELTAVTLDKPRHQSTIFELRNLGIKVYAIPDGDIMASILVCMPKNNIDLMYCIGGAPEGVISAAAVKALGGDMIGRLMTRNLAKGKTLENDKITEQEESRLLNMGLTAKKTLRLKDIVRTDNVTCIATGITHGSILKGVHYENGFLYSNTLIIHGQPMMYQNIHTTHQKQNVTQHSKEISHVTTQLMRDHAII